MAVYTHVSAEDISAFLSRYDAGELRVAKGIAEGVENSNYLIETTTNRFILTLYEKRVDEKDLPFFIALLDHLGAKGCKVPRFIPDQNGKRLQTLAGRPACLIEFLTGVSVTEPTPAQCEGAGQALGTLHRAAHDFTMERPNALGPDGWRKLLADLGDGADTIAPGLNAKMRAIAAEILEGWPTDLATSVIHADLFPDNILSIADEVTGIIDFYFACTDIRAYDLAIMHGSWCFSHDGRQFFPDRAAALIKGYEESHGLTPEERAALPILCQGAALRFFLTRAYDWIHTPPDALVMRKDPLAYMRRLDIYRTYDAATLFGAA